MPSVNKIKKIELDKYTHINIKNPNKILIIKQERYQKQTIYYSKFDNSHEGIYISETINRSENGIDMKYSFKNAEAEKETLAKFNLTKGALEEIIKNNN